MKLYAYLAALFATFATLPTVSAEVARNGARYNGARYNGARYNGARYNGARYNGAEIMGVDTSGAALGSFGLEGSLLVGSYADAPDSTCAHSELETGGPLAPGCSTCVDIVQSNVSWCNGSWHGFCTWLARNWCEVDSYDLIGATLVAEGMDGEAIELRIDSVQTVPDPTPKWGLKIHPGGGLEVVNLSENENADVLMYGITYYDAGTGGWAPLCNFTDDDGYYNRALAVQGVWADCEGVGCGGRTGQDGFTFACRDVGAIAKCVEIGYKPHVPITVCNSNPTCPDGDPTTDDDCYHACRTEDLADHHEACVRMLRADYCGDGVPHTVDGTRINVWDLDNFSAAPYVEAADPAYPSWGFEAAWDPTGAFCISDERSNGLDPGGSGGTIAAYILANCPARYDQLVGTSATCESGHNWQVFDFDRAAYIKNLSSSLIKVGEIAFPGGGEIKKKM